MVRGGWGEEGRGGGVGYGGWDGGFSFGGVGCYREGGVRLGVLVFVRGSGGGGSVVSVFVMRVVLGWCLVCGVGSIGFEG